MPVVLAVGEHTRAAGLCYARPAELVAARLGAPLVVFPGHHISYFDQPVEWTAKLRETLRSL